MPTLPNSDPIRGCTAVVPNVVLLLLLLWYNGSAQTPPARIVRTGNPHCHSDPPLIVEMMGWFSWHLEASGMDKEKQVVTDSARLRLAIWIDTRIIKIHPDPYISYGSRGLTWFRLGEYDRAFADYQKSLEICPEDAWTLSNLGYIYFIRGDMAQAEGVYRDAVMYDTGFLDARRNLGVICALQQRFGEAITEWKAGLDIDPDNALLIFYIGSALKDSGRGEESEAWFEKAYGLDPGLKK